MSTDIRIATVFTKDFFNTFVPSIMSTIRWLRISEGLANLGYKVDMIINTNTKTGLTQKTPNLRFKLFSTVDWSQYDMIKTLFHRGFMSLHNQGGSNHPFLISKVGSVVGASDDVEGVHFFNKERESLFEIQKMISKKSRYITILTEPSILLWEKEFGNHENILMVPTGVDREIPPPKNNPYRDFNEKIAVYIGHIYDKMQRETNLLWQGRLNTIGKLLKTKRIRLCFVGTGMIDKLDHNVVTYLGSIENAKIWDYHYFASAGIVLAQGRVQHNESSKIYYYLRAGLPVVSEAPAPNNSLIREANLGFISDYEDNQLMADMIEAAIHKKWEKEYGIRYILENHTWDNRVKLYDNLIRRKLGLPLEGAL